jgi:hypothetical protein
MDSSAIVLGSFSEQLDRLVDVHQDKKSSIIEILANALKKGGASTGRLEMTQIKQSESLYGDIRVQGGTPRDRVDPTAGSEGTEVEILATVERIFNLDTIEQSFCAQVFVKMLWRCPQSEDEGGNALPTPDADDGDWVPLWTPKYRFRNLLEELYDPKEFYTPVVIDGNIYVKAEIRHLMKIAEPLELKAFPVDCQDLKIELLSRMSTEQLKLRPMRKHLRLKRYRRSMDAKFARRGSSLGAPTKDCEFARLQKEQCVLNDFDFVHKFPFNYNMYTLCLDDDEEVSVVKMRINLQRKSFYYVLNVWFVVACIVSFVFCAWGLHPGDVGNRLSVDLTLVLTLVAFRLVLESMLPKTSYMTWLDIYVMGAFMFLTVVTVLHSTFPFTWFSKVEMSAITEPPYSFEGNREQDMVDGDILLLYVLAGVWTFFNVGFALYVYIGGNQLHANCVQDAKAQQLEDDNSHDEVLRTKGLGLSEAKIEM